MKDMVILKRRSSLSQIAIIITDGKANMNTAQTIPNAQAAKDKDITIIALGCYVKYIYIYIYIYIIIYLYIYIYIYI